MSNSDAEFIDDFIYIMSLYKIEKTEEEKEDKRGYFRKYNKKYRDTLDDTYIKKILKKSGFIETDNKEIIDAKKQIIKIKRLCKTLKT